MTHLSDDLQFSTYIFYGLFKKKWVLQTELSAIHSLLLLGRRYCFRDQLGWAYSSWVKNAMLPAMCILVFCMKKAWLEGDHNQDLSSGCFLCPHGMLESASALVWNVGPIFLEDQSWSLKKSKDDTDSLRHFGSLRASLLNCCVNTAYKINVSPWNVLLLLLLYSETGLCAEDWKSMSPLLLRDISVFLCFYVCICTNSVSLFVPCDASDWVLQISRIPSETACVHCFMVYWTSFGLVSSKEQCSSFLGFSPSLLSKTLSYTHLPYSWVWLA